METQLFKTQLVDESPTLWYPTMIPNISKPNFSMKTQIFKIQLLKPNSSKSSLKLTYVLAYFILFKMRFALDKK